MKKTWKKLLAAVCALSMLMTLLGMGVLADELQEELIISAAEDPVREETAEIPYDELIDAGEVSEDVLADDILADENVFFEEKDGSLAAKEDVVGIGEYTVGDGVTATFDEETGAIEFYSNGGTLWGDWTDKAEIDRWSIESIRVASGTVYLPADSSGYNENYHLQVFGGLENLEELDLAGFDSSNVTDMSRMFYHCNSLTNLDLSGFDTSNVKDMSQMFHRCWSLTSLNLSGFDTSNVKDMSRMFAGCDSLTNLDLSNFDTSNVTNMADMFDFCSCLTNLNLSSFDTSNVTNMSSMFYFCSSLTNLDLSGFDTSKVENHDSIFHNCNGLRCLQTPRKNNLSISLPVLMCDESGVMYNKLPVLNKSIILTRKETDEIIVGEYVTATFDKETGAVEFYSNDGELWDNWLDISGIYKYDIKSIKVVSGTVYLPNDSSDIFSGVEYLEELDLSGFDTSNVTNMNSMFEECNSLTNLDLSGIDTSKVTDMQNMFYKCSGLTSLDLSDFETSKVKDMSHMFSYCESLTSLNLSGFDTSCVTNMENMFACCESLTSLDLSSFNTSNVTIMNGDDGYMDDYCGMFSGCVGLTSLDLSRFDTSNVTDMSGMFYNCNALASLDLSSFDTSNVTNMGRMFDCCYSLTDLDLSSFDTSNVFSMMGMFRSCSSLTSLELNGFDTSNVKYMGGGPSDWGTFGMFQGCSSLISLDLSNFNTSNVTDMSNMFFYCSGLKNLDLSSFDTSNVKNMDSMFDRCFSLTDLDLSSFDTSNVGDMEYMFNRCFSLTDLDLSSFDTSNVGDMECMFGECSSLTNLDLSSFDTSNVKYKNGMFKGCSALLLLKTPKKNELSIDLPCTMYDESGSAYEELPVFSESIILTKEKPEIRIDLNDCVITLSASRYTYDGNAKKPSVTVKNGDAVLASGMDYTVSYSDNTNAGTATVTVTGTGNYKGEKSVTFTINKADAKLTFAESTLAKKTTDAAFTNTLTKTTDGTVTFKSGNTKVANVDSTSGLVTIKGAGTATITATASEGQNYKSGSASYTLKVEAPVPTPIPTPAVTGFSDVQDPKHAYYNAIYWAADAGITKGYPDGTFGINRSCTRGEMIMFLWRYAGKPTPKTVSKSPFKDVAKTHAFYKAILWASQKGITKGYPDGTFGIERNVSRGECMMFLWRVKGKPAPKAVAKSPFKDVAATNAFYKAILWGYQNKITTGYTSGAKKGTFGIDENCTRGQIVTFLYRAR